MRKLRKITCLILVAMMLLSTSGIAHATYVEAEELHLPPWSDISSDVMPMEFPRNGIIPAKSYFYITEYYVTQGQTVLRVNSCTWSPQHPIAIGFYACNASTTYGINFYGGYTNTYTIGTSSLPSGEYWIYVYNYGTGEISFELNYDLIT